jgi:hypothetical protein
VRLERLSELLGLAALKAEPLEICSFPTADRMALGQQIGRDLERIDHAFMGIRKLGHVAFVAWAQIQ